MLSYDRDAGETAILLAQGYQPNLILLDVMLPDINGIEVVQRLKQNQETERDTSYCSNGFSKRRRSRSRLILAGCNAYISKPYILEGFRGAYPLLSSTCVCCLVAIPAFGAKTATILVRPVSNA